MVLQAYVDDSGDSGQPPAYVLAGFIGHLDQWSEFSARWDALLNLSPKLDYVKMSEAAALAGQFKGWSEVERDERLLKFVALIQSHYVFGFSSVIPVDAWNDIMRGKAPADFKNIYYLNFFSLIMSLSKTPWIRELDSRIEFIFDESGVLGDRVQAKWTTFYGAMPDHVKKFIAGRPSHRDDKETPALQAADILAWHVRRYYHEVLLNDQYYESKVWRAVRSLKLNEVFVKPSTMENLIKAWNEI